MYKLLNILLLCLLGSIYGKVQGQIKGKILSPDQNPIVGASVELKHGGVRTVSDSRGDFVIPITGSSDTLIVTHVGYRSTQVPVSNNPATPLFIILETIEKELEEVIVSTGLQRVPKERVTGSFTLVDNKLFNEQVGTNVINRLQYVSNGYSALPARNTGGYPILVVRGLSTLTTSIAKPLIIVDNFEYLGDINNINPNDVENATFLKDAAAGSIWGAKAANGVIVITTKKGAFNRPTKVEVNTNLTIAGKPNLFYNKNISSSDFIELEKYLFEQGFYSSMLSSPQYYPLSSVVNLLDKANRGLISQAQADAQIEAMRGQDVRREYSNHFYQRAVNQQYAINLSGGTKNLAWILSTGFDKNSDELNAGYTRFNMRMENVYAPAKNLEVTTSVYYAQSKTTSGRPSFGSITTQMGAIAPYTGFADETANPLPVYTTYNSSYLDTAGGGKLLNWNYYPLTDYQFHDNQMRIENLNAVLGLRYKVFKNLNVNIRYRYQRQQDENEYIRRQGSFYTRNLINLYSQINGGSVVYKVPKGDVLDLSQSTLTAQNFRAQLNYSQKWGSHEVTALAGTEISETISKSNSSRTYGYNGDILTYGNVDYTNTYPLFPYGSNAYIPNGTGFGKRNDRLVSFFVNGAYSYLNRYTLYFSARRDASNLFGVKTNDKWKPLWSTGLSWELSKEPFYQLVAFPYLRLKITYGFQGNIDPTKVASTTIRYSGNNPLTQTPFAVVQYYYNPELKWEQVGMLNTSIEWASKNRRLSGSIEYYEKRMTDLYAAMPIESTMGVGATMIRNVGEMKGHGWDIEVNTVNLNGKFQWQSNFILNTYTDKITKAKSPSLLLGADVVGGNGSTTLEGFSPYVYFAYPWAGLDPATGDPQGYLNGQVSKDYAAITYEGTKFSDVKYIGSLSPRIFGSIGNSFSWKGVSLNIRITYKFNYYFRRESINYSSLVNQSFGHSDYALRWQKQGDENFTTVPSFTYPINSSRDDFYQNAEILATKGDHIRLQYINLSYDLKSQLKRIPINQATVYVVCNNVGMIWKANKFGIDPEYSNNSIPPARSITIGLRIGL